jgi:hypothetical protein
MRCVVLRAVFGILLADKPAALVDTRRPTAQRPTASMQSLRITVDLRFAQCTINATKKSAARLLETAGSNILAVHQRCTTRRLSSRTSSGSNAGRRTLISLAPCMFQPLLSRRTSAHERRLHPLRHPRGADIHPHHTGNCCAPAVRGQHDGPLLIVSR